MKILLLEHSLAWVNRNFIPMLFKYVKLSFRLLIRNPFFTLINIVCLSVGFAMFFILWQHSQNELHSHQFHKDYSRIVRQGVRWNWTDDGSNWQQANYGGVMARSCEELKSSPDNNGKINLIIITRLLDLMQGRFFKVIIKKTLAPNSDTS
jgi:hypothetical protein